MSRVHSAKKPPFSRLNSPGPVRFLTPEPLFFPLFTSLDARAFSFLPSASRGATVDGFISGPPRFFPISAADGALSPPLLPLRGPLLLPQPTLTLPSSALALRGMGSFDNDDLALPVVEEFSYSLLKPKLKRLKKASSSPLPRKLAADVSVIDHGDMLISPSVPVPIEIRTSSSDAMRHENSDRETSPTADLDPLFVYRSIEETLESPSVEVREGREDGGPVDKEAVVVVESKKEKTPKRRLSFVDEDDDTNKKKKKKGRSRKLEAQNMKPKETVREQKKLEKARKAELEHLHAESQRLLRETREASFKPAQLIQKPICSVLEKIRLRKLEIFKRHSGHSWMPSIVDSDCPEENGCNSDPVYSQSKVKKADDKLKEADDKLKEADDNAKVDNGLNSASNSLLNALEACSSPYLPISSLKIGGDDNHYVAASVGGCNVSSSEESDKENIGPRACKFVNMNSCPKDGLAKAFLDDEAEEEDDSDGDRLRFQEIDEESETDECEELADLIATGNEEAPIDQEKRNELHQKWLEHQDAAETENVLQRLKCHQGFRGSSFIHGYSHSYDGSDDDDDNDKCDDTNTLDCDDEAAYKQHTIHTVHQGLKKAKQMISQMFTDTNDVYIPSDDEEAERNFVRHHILKQNEEPSIISPVEDENSRDFFGLIKKLNIAPDAKKRGKTSASVFDSVIASGNSNSSSKSSFLNRTSNSLPSLHKQGSSLSKTFIFGRDDSNSRSNFSTTEINSDLDQNGIGTAKNVTDKISSTQAKSSVTKRKVQADQETSSLFNILRQSSIKFESKDYDGPHVITESQAAHKFSAFKLRRISKLE